MKFIQQRKHSSDDSITEEQSRIQNAPTTAETVEKKQQAQTGQPVSQQKPAVKTGITELVPATRASLEVIDPAAEPAISFREQPDVSELTQNNSLKSASGQRPVNREFYASITATFTFGNFKRSAERAFDEDERKSSKLRKMTEPGSRNKELGFFSFLDSDKSSTRPPSQTSLEAARRSGSFADNRRFNRTELIQSLHRNSLDNQNSSVVKNYTFVNQDRNRPEQLNDEHNGIDNKIVQGQICDHVLTSKLDLCILFNFKDNPSDEVFNREQILEAAKNAVLQIDGLRISFGFISAELAANNQLLATRFSSTNETSFQAIEFATKSTSLFDHVTSLAWREEALHLVWFVNQHQSEAVFQTELADPGNKRLFDSKLIRLKQFKWETDLGILNVSKMFDIDRMREALYSELVLHKRRELHNLAREWIKDESDFQKYKQSLTTKFEDNLHLLKRFATEYEAKLIRLEDQRSICALYSELNDDFVWATVLDDPRAALNLSMMRQDAFRFIVQFNCDQETRHSPQDIYKLALPSETWVNYDPNHAVWFTNKTQPLGRASLANYANLPVTHQVILSEFTHYSYVTSGNEMMIVVLNASLDNEDMIELRQITILDFVIFSRDHRYGASDLGPRGIECGLAHHR